MTILSALYLVHVFLSEDTTLNADAVGGDPGGKLLPFIMGGFMFLGFLYLTIKERPVEEKNDKESVLLFLETVGVVVLYIVIQRLLGFVICTVLLLFSQIYIYSTIGQKRSLSKASLGALVTLVLSVGTYFLFRFATRKLLRYGRQGVIPSFFGNSSVTGAISLLILTVITLVIIFTLCRKAYKGGNKEIAIAGIVSFSLTLFLYIVFKQFFQVNLALGLLNY